MARRSENWNVGLAHDLRDPEFAREFLLGAVEKGVPVQAALGQVIRAMGVKECAAKVRMASPNALRAINPRHTPTHDTLIGSCGRSGCGSHSRPSNAPQDGVLSDRWGGFRCFSITADAAVRDLVARTSRRSGTGVSHRTRLRSRLGRCGHAFPGMWTERATRSENRHHDDGSAQADGMAEVCYRRGPLPALSLWRRQYHRRRCAPRPRLLGPLRPRYHRRRRGGTSRLGLFRPAGGPLLTCRTQQAFNQGQQDEQGQQEQPFERHG